MGRELRTGQGGKVPGSGQGDKIDAKYEPGEFVASNDMLDAAPGLREQLHSLRSQVLAAKGMTPEQADAKALGYDDPHSGGQDGHTKGVRSGVQERLEGRGQFAGMGGMDDQARGALGDRVHPLQQVSLRALDGFEISERPWNGSQDSRQFARQPGPGNPNIGANGSAQSQAFQQARAPAAPAPAATQPIAPAAKPTLRAGLAEQPRLLGKASVAGGRLVAGVAKALGPAAAGAEVVSHFNDYKINDPGVDSSAGGTWSALRNGDFGGAGRSLSKGALETGMDLGSAAADIADYVVPGKAPVSTAYNKMLRNQFGDQLAPHAGVAAQADAATPPAAAAPSAAPKPATTDSAPMPGQDPWRVTLRSQAGAEVQGAPGVSKFTQNGKTLYSNVSGDDNDKLMSNRPGVSVVPGMSQAEINRTLTNPDGSRWGEGDNAIMAANMRDGRDAYEGTSRNQGAAQDRQLRELAASPFGTPGRNGAMKALIAKDQNAATLRGQDITERDNVRTNDTSLRNSAATNKLGYFNATREQGNADRTYGLAAGTQAQALGEKYRDNARKEFEVIGADGTRTSGCCP